MARKSKKPGVGRPGSRESDPRKPRRRSRGRRFLRRPHRRLKLQQVDFRQHGRAPWCALTVSEQGGAFGSLAARAPRAGASADSGILSRHQKFFFKNVLRQKGYPPLGGRNRFWTGFWGRGHEQFSEFKSPPYRGSHLPHAHPSSFEIQGELTTAAGLRRIRRLGRNNWIWRLSDDVAARWR